MMETVTNQIYMAHATNPKKSCSEAEVQMEQAQHNIWGSDIYTNLFTTYSATELPNLHLLISETEEQK